MPVARRQAEQHRARGRPPPSQRGHQPQRRAREEQQGDQHDAQRDRHAEVGLQHEQREDQQTRRARPATARASTGASPLRRSASTCAPHSVSATFAASEGCTVNGPNANQAREPLRSDAERGRAPRPAARRRPRRNGGGQRPQLPRRDPQPDPEHREPGHAEQQLLGEHRVRRAARRVASTDDAESTMTSPNSVSRPNTPSTRCSEVSGRRSHWPNADAARPTAIRRRGAAGRRRTCGRAARRGAWPCAWTSAPTGPTPGDRAGHDRLPGNAAAAAANASPRAA